MAAPARRGHDDEGEAGQQHHRAGHGGHGGRERPRGRLESTLCSLIYFDINMNYLYILGNKLRGKIFVVFYYLKKISLYKMLYFLGVHVCLQESVSQAGLLYSFFSLSFIILILRWMMPSQNSTPVEMKSNDGDILSCQFFNTTTSTI